jgi:hypothetical protein
MLIIYFRQNPIKVSRRYFTLVDFLGIFAEFYELFAVAVIAHFMPPAIMSIEKLVSTLDQPSCHERETCVYWICRNLNNNYVNP